MQSTLAARKTRSSAVTRLRFGVPRRLLARVRAWIDACADHYAATAMYEQLSRLSDAELQRRGLARANLAQEVRAAAGRSNRSHCRCTGVEST